jgi:site-specific DNA-methyltransferase (adenine-specific)
MHKCYEKCGGGYFDGIITDPPYSSGGSDAQVGISTTKKYQSPSMRGRLPDFDGETMDTRVWMGFMAEVLRVARGLCVPGAVCCAFVDWRRLPALEDAFQRAGWYTRGVVIWDKTEGVRPHRGRYRQQAEFVVWGSNGTLPLERGVPPLPGVYRHANVTRDKLHQVQKPLELMRSICKIVPAGGRILDPFCGSGTTLEAARLEGLSAVGIESSDEICRIAAQRLGVDIDDKI